MNKDKRLPKNKLLSKIDLNESIIKNKILVSILALCIIISIAAITLSLADGAKDRRDAGKLSQDVEREIKNIKSEISNMDRDTFVTVDDKVIVGFLEFPNNNRYPVINVFDENTSSSSFCRQGANMPWDLEGMTIYGIKSFTKELEKIQDDFQLVFEDLAGEKYQYKYQKNPKEQVIDYGIIIFMVDKEGNEKECYQFVRK